MKKSAWFLISTLLTLVACQSEETGILPKKALSESEERYLQIGTTYSFSFDLSNAGHQEIEELSFYSKRYQDGEPVEEDSNELFTLFFDKDTPFSAYEELTLAIKEQELDETLYYTCWIEGVEKEGDRVMYSTGPLAVPALSGVDGKVALEAEQLDLQMEDNPLVLIHSGNSGASNWYEPKQLQQTIADEQDVLVFGLI
ncbi:hypothetical protein KHT87_07640, partial [Alkalihalobacillus clausii]